MLALWLATWCVALAIKEANAWPTPADVNSFCGKQEIDPHLQEGRIVNGHVAVLHSWPWQASLYVEFFVGETIYFYQCGGAILNNEWVITAAHCFYLPEQLRALRWMIHVGEKVKDRYDHTVQIREVEEYIIHEDFEFPNFDNDIAVVKLRRPIKFNTYVHPICIPPEGRDVPENTFCVVAGFAHNEQGIIPELAALHQLITPIIPRKNCSAKEFYGGKITQDMICSGYVSGISDTCRGDSGRPLMCMIEDKWYAKGVLSYGPNQCGKPKKPGVYTKISSFVSWIREKTNPKRNNDMQGRHPQTLLINVK